MRPGVDVAGTFTDAVLALREGALHRAKAPVAPGDESAGVLEAISTALAAAGALGRDTLDRRPLPRRHTTALAAGVRLRTETSGGGGHGAAGSV